MEYKRFNNTIFLRLDPGEEIIEKLIEISNIENIKLAHFNGLGAINEFEVGLFDTETKQYYSNIYSEPYEISSLHGTITQQSNKPYIHAHLNAANKNNIVIGGHLNKAIISATGEIVVNIVNGEIDRLFNNNIGLNLFDFNN